MSYYARPMGDYKTYGYAGDPGFLSSIWKGIRKIAPIVGSIFGGPVGGLIGGAVAGTAVARQPTGIAPGQIGGAISFPGGTSIGLGFAPQTAVQVPGRGRLPPFTAAGPGVLPGGGRTGTMAPAGFHLDKLTGTRWVRNRRMNVANPRALRRSMRRVQGFEKLAKRTIQFTRRVKMKKRRTS